MANISRIVQLYAEEVKAGKITIDSVPAGLKAKVTEYLSAAEDAGNE